MADTPEVQALAKALLAHDGYDRDEIEAAWDMQSSETKLKRLYAARVIIDALLVLGVEVQARGEILGSKWNVSARQVAEDLVNGIRADRIDGNDQEVQRVADVIDGERQSMRRIIEAYGLVTMEDAAIAALRAERDDLARRVAAAREALDGIVTSVREISSNPQEKAKPMPVLTPVSFTPRDPKNDHISIEDGFIAEVDHKARWDSELVYLVKPRNGRDPGTWAYVDEVKRRELPP